MTAVIHITRFVERVSISPQLNKKTRGEQKEIRNRDKKLNDLLYQSHNVMPLLNMDATFRIRMHQVIIVV